MVRLPRSCTQIRPSNRLRLEACQTSKRSHKTQASRSLLLDRSCKQMAGYIRQLQRYTCRCRLWRMVRSSMPLGWYNLESRVHHKRRRRPHRSSTHRRNPRTGSLGMYTGKEHSKLHLDRMYKLQDRYIQHSCSNHRGRHPSNRPWGQSCKQMATNTLPPNSFRRRRSQLGCTLGCQDLYNLQSQIHHRCHLRPRR